MVQLSNRIDPRRWATRNPTSGRRRRRRIMLYGAAAVATLAVVVGALVAGRAIAHGEAFRNAERTTTELANQVGPLLTDTANGDSTHIAELNRAIDNRKRAGFLKQVTIWGADGQVIYADDPKQIGRRLDPPIEVTEAITEGAVSAEFEAQPEVYEVKLDESGPGFVEVYVPLDRPGNTRVAFEAYYDYSRAAADGDQLFRQFLPLVLVLLLLLIVQLPVAALIRRRRARRRGLVDPALTGGGKERIRVAADLHDGPIQDIAGVGYALGALGLSVPEDGKPLMRQAQQSLQRAQRSLRRLMVDLYPLDLTADRLPAAITSLSGPLSQHGIDVQTTFEPLPPLSDDNASALYQGAHEALANVAEHAHASRVHVHLSVPGGPRAGPGIVQLQITDNGVGFDPDSGIAPRDGHQGLRVLEHRLQGLGGSLHVTTGPDGTTVRVGVPVNEH